jgi:F0F1-type ATP synthase delta subunit
VESDLSNLTNALQTNATFARFVKDPCISRKSKNEAMAQAVASADETTRKFAGAFC